jgi:hypothetical protein
MSTNEDVYDITLTVRRKQDFHPYKSQGMTGNSLLEVLSKFSLMMYQELQKEVQDKVKEQLELHGVHTEDDIPF